MGFYAVQRLVGKIDDAPELRDELIAIFDTKTKNELAQFGLKLAEHIMDFSGFAVNDEIANAFAAVREWIGGGINYHKPRTLAGAINDLARENPDPIKVKFYRAMAQISCIPHVKFHALWACDFAVAIINRQHPCDLDAARQERQTQIELMANIKEESKQ
jgi:hypothetical protein